MKHFYAFIYYNMLHADWFILSILFFRGREELY